MTIVFLCLELVWRGLGKNRTKHRRNSIESKPNNHNHYNKIILKT